MLPVSTILLTLIAPVVAGVVGAIVITLGMRERRLNDLADKHKELKMLLVASTVAAEIDAVVEFLRAVEKRRGRIFVRIADIHDKFGSWFLPIAHAQHGLDPFLSINSKHLDEVKSLYRAWAHYGNKHDADKFQSPAAKRWARQTNRQRSKTRILWHHKMQESGSTLFFWRLRFEPKYNRDEILNSLDLVCEDFKVKSYVAYELLGPHDILLRAWMSDPHGASGTERTASEKKRSGWKPSRVDHMTQRLRKHTSDESNTYFEVEEVYRHWWWMRWRPWTDEISPRKGSQDERGDRTDAERIVNAYNAGDISRFGLWLTPVWWRYRWKRMIRRRRLHGGIKFATVVRTKPGRMAPEHNSEHPVVDAVKRAWRVRDRSVYAGKGFHQDKLGEAQFLILGRVRAIHFGRLRKRVINPILKRPISDNYAPPLTYIATGPDTMRRTLQDGLANNK